MTSSLHEQGCLTSSCPVETVIPQPLTDLFLMNKLLPSESSNRSFLPSIASFTRYLPLLGRGIPLGIAASFFLQSAPTILGQISSQDEKAIITQEFETTNFRFNTDPKYTPISSYNGCTYFVWVDASLRPWVSKVVSSTGVVTSMPLDSDPSYMVQNDGHHQFSIGIDKDGYIHISGDMHNYYPGSAGYISKYSGKNIMYWVSDAPESVGSFTFHGGTPARAIPGFGFTYQNFYTDNNGELYFMARAKVHTSGHYSGEHGVTLSRYNTVTKSWTELGGYAPVTPSNPHTATYKSILWEDNGTYSASNPARSWYQGYQCGLVFDKNNRMHFAGSVCNDNTKNDPTHVIYAYSDDGGNTFKRANGTAIAALPMRAESGPNQGDIVCNTGAWGSSAYPFVDVDGRPGVCFSKVGVPGNDSTFVKVWDTSSWSPEFQSHGRARQSNRHYVDPRGVGVFSGDFVYRSHLAEEDGYRLPVNGESNINGTMITDARGLREEGVIRVMSTVNSKLRVSRINIVPQAWSQLEPTSFDGLTTFVSGGKLYGSDPALSIAFSMKAAKLANMIPVDKEPKFGTKGWTIKLRSTGELYFRIGSNDSFTDVKVPGAYSAGTDVHVVATFSGGTAKIYLNGILKNTVSGISHGVDETETLLRLGIPSAVSLGERFEGELRNVRVFNHVIPDQDIAALAMGAVYMQNQLTTFSGDEMYLEGGKYPGSAPALTAAFRIKPNSVAHMKVMEKLPRLGTAGWSVMLRNTGELLFRVGSNDDFSDSNVPAAYVANTEYHIACTFTGGTAKLYINGVLRKTVTGITTRTVAEHDTPMRIGMPGGQPISGTVKKVRLFHRALSDAEVAQLAAEP